MAPPGPALIKGNQPAWPGQGAGHCRHHTPSAPVNACLGLDRRRPRGSGRAGPGQDCPQGLWETTGTVDTGRAWWTHLGVPAGPVRPDSLQEWSGGPCPNPAGGPGTGPLTFWGLCFVKPRKAPRPSCKPALSRVAPPLQMRQLRSRGGCGGRHATTSTAKQEPNTTAWPREIHLLLPGRGGSALVECSGGVTLTIAS